MNGRPPLPARRDRPLPTRVAAGVDVDRADLVAVVLELFEVLVLSSVVASDGRGVGLSDEVRSTLAQVTSWAEALR